MHDVVHSNSRLLSISAERTFFWEGGKGVIGLHTAASTGARYLVTVVVEPERCMPGTYHDGKRIMLRRSRARECVGL